MGTNKSTWRFAAALAACSLAGSALAAVQRPVAVSGSIQAERPSALSVHFLESARRAVGLLEEGDVPAAVTALDAVLADPLLATLSGEQRAFIGWMSGLAAWQMGDKTTARDRLEHATMEDRNNPDIWQALATVEQELENRDRAALYFAKLLQRWPERVSQLETYVVNDLVFQGRGESDERLEMMQAMFDAGWTRDERGASGTWRELAIALLDRGQTGKVRAVVQRIDDPLVLVDLRSDLRFDPVADTIAALPSVEDAAIADVERFRKRVSEHPRRVDLASDLGAALLVAGKNEEALAQSDAALATFAATDEATLEHFDERIWISNNRAVALRRLGRPQEAALEMERARLWTEAGGVNVSQSLNLGMLYCHMGRPADARRVLGKLGPLSDYGRMVELSVRHCIALQDGHMTEAENLVGQLYDRRSDGEAVMLDVLFRTGDVERAAGELMRQLREPASRDEALDMVHTYLMAPALPGTAAARRTREMVLRRADVQAAIALVGRHGQFGVYDLAGIE